ncbi:MAG: hypothetical protein HN580_09020 [Deltaproteobacteria bacterium]|jgi:hypothetical protein|nr:hypothetical protein [Deltaproteobacteria bacterium]MBT4268453.1 hypothetical protein [Deltaproteobacteria bacterium]MBT4638570.1 hypothetical protein [Deltaproteobacteria bacterium]MBT6613191.1 hypothetical protein [Deltaproteobacteria bacterium]MBT7889150.1 hypothetical protein [Deltaproteobacteria bacterium]
MDSKSYDIKYIPEYKTGDSVSNRLVALVMLEQFTDERTMTADIVQDLMKIALMSRYRNEKRIFNMANLMIKQGLRYVQKEGMISIKIPSKDFQLLELLKISAEKLDASEQFPPQKFFNALSRINKQDNHYLVRFFINSLIKSYNERANFTGVLTYKKK